MLTRLRINGFKNLVDVDVRFGPFTCIAGANGVGKSNLLDAIRFLSALASQEIVAAALSVRDQGGRTGDIRSLFNRAGGQFQSEMKLEAEMIVPQEGTDDLGQNAKASITFLRYTVSLAYREASDAQSLGRLELISEELTHINLGEAKANLPFTHSAEWRDSVVRGRRSGGKLISMKTDETPAKILIHQDKGSGRPRKVLASSTPRTVLSVANAAENPTATMARREMQSWRLLQLEPSALREPDPFTVPTRIGSNGAHLPATLFRLAKTDGSLAEGGGQAKSPIYSQVANRLSELVEDVRNVWVDRDERRELLTLYLAGRDGTPHAARALSDGTLRFLALTVLELDREEQGLLCLEEPENGISPARVKAMIQLLKDIATDPRQAVDEENPLRQVIINTHSPTVVGIVPDDSLVIAQSEDVISGRQHSRRVVFRCLDGTWRAKVGEPIVARGDLLSYLNPLPINVDDRQRPARDAGAGDAAPPRVMDRSDLQQLLPFGQVH